MTEPTPEQAARGYTRIVAFDELKAALEKAVEARGADYVYSELCIYVDRHGEPRCGIGFALIELGLRAPMVDAILEWQREETSTNVGVEKTGQPQAHAVLDKIARRGVRFTPRARVLAHGFQWRQDGQMPWGQALEESVEVALSAGATGEVPADVVD